MKPHKASFSNKWPSKATILKSGAPKTPPVSSQPLNNCFAVIQISTHRIQLPQSKKPLPLQFWCNKLWSSLELQRTKNRLSITKGLSFLIFLWINHKMSLWRCARILERSRKLKWSKTKATLMEAATSISSLNLRPRKLSHRWWVSKLGRSIYTSRKLSRLLMKRLLMRSPRTQQIVERFSFRLSRTNQQTAWFWKMLFLCKSIMSQKTSKSLSLTCRMKWKSMGQSSGRMFRDLQSMVVIPRSNRGSAKSTWDLKM